MVTLLDRFTRELAQNASLPARPEILNRLIGVLGGGDDVSLIDLASVIHQDAALSGGVLKIANAAAYGAQRRILSIPEALLRIGLRQTGRLALALSLHNMIPRACAGTSPREFWMHCLGTATAASVIVRQKPGLAADVDDESAFLLGLFHDVGLLALAGRYDREYTTARRAADMARRPYHEVEPDVLGTDHGALGALIVETWGLPKLAVEAIRWHHAADVSPEVRRRVELIQLAEAICVRGGLGDLAEGDHHPDDWRWTVGGSEIGPEDIDQFVEEAREETDRSEALLSLAC